MKESIRSPETQTRIRRFCLIFLMAVLIGIMLPVHSHAAAYQNRWVVKKNKYYYYDESGRVVKGLRKIGNLTYLLSPKGVQYNGWRKIGKKYYFFRIANGKYGYMIVNKTVNGVKLRKDGSAVLTSRSKRKLWVMVKCQNIIDSLAAPGVPRSRKLRLAFEYAKKHFRARNIGSFSASSDWDVRYAQYMLSAGSGDCYCYGAVFAYLANAVGYTNVYACSSGGHGWCRIAGRYYDPNWARVIGSYKCYGATRAQSGSGGRPAWATNELYTKNLSR